VLLALLGRSLGGRSLVRSMRMFLTLTLALTLSLVVVPTISPAVALRVVVVGWHMLLGLRRLLLGLQPKHIGSRERIHAHGRHDRIHVSDIGKLSVIRIGPEVLNDHQNLAGDVVRVDGGRMVQIIQLLLGIVVGMTLMVVVLLLLAERLRLLLVVLLGTVPTTVLGHFLALGFLWSVRHSLSHFGKRSEDH
jgi:hypothetical protein